MIFLLILLLLGALFALVFIDARRTLPYIYCNAMISTWEGKMLDSKKMAELSELNLDGIASALVGTDFEGLPLGDVERMEEEMRERCVAKYREIIVNLPKKSRKFFELLLERFDVYNIKTVLVSLHTGQVPRFISSPLSGKERLQLLAQVKDLETLLDFLRGTEYATVLQESLEEYKRRGLPYLFWKLDSFYYQRLWTEARKQRRSVKELVGVEIDIVNLKVILRLKKEGIPPDEIKRLLIKPSYLIPNPLLDQMVDAGDLFSALQLLSNTPYGEVASRVSHQIQTTGSLLPLEKEMEEGLLRLCKWYSSSDFFSLAPAVSYFYRKEAELRNLRVLLRFKMEGLQPAECRELMLHEV